MVDSVKIWFMKECIAIVCNKEFVTASIEWVKELMNYYNGKDFYKLSSSNTVHLYLRHCYNMSLGILIWGVALILMQRAVFERNIIKSKRFGPSGLKEIE